MIEDRRAGLARDTTWTHADVEEFEQALREQRAIDLERPDAARTTAIAPARIE